MKALYKCSPFTIFTIYIKASGEMDSDGVWRFATLYFIIVCTYMSSNILKVQIKLAKCMFSSAYSETL